MRNIEKQYQGILRKLVLYGKEKGAKYLQVVKNDIKRDLR